MPRRHQTAIVRGPRRAASGYRAPSRRVLLALPLVLLGVTIMTSDWPREARATPQATRPTTGSRHASARAAGVSLPLSTSGRWIVDATGQRVRLAAVNWYGAESPEYVVGGLDRRSLGSIADWIKAHGFNAVRIPFSNEMWETNPAVKRKYLRDNPGLIGMHARQILDQVIDALGSAGLMVILDDHTTNAGWCCKAGDGNGLWYGKKWHGGQFTESEWIADWTQIASHYAADPWVVGAELRNELRPDAGGAPYWGNPSPSDCAGAVAADRNDWPAAATCAGDAVLAANPKLLVIVDGLDYSTDLRGVYHDPIQLSVPDKLVYAAHNYADEDDGLTDSGPGSYSAFKRRLGDEWGYIITEHQPYTAPVWVSEFGACLTGGCRTWHNDMYFAYIRRYLGDASFDWAYWPLNGTESKGRDLNVTRRHGALESYGLLNRSWSGPSNPSALTDIEQLEPPTTNCTFSQTCSPATLERAPGAGGTVDLPAGEGLYVVCVTAGPSYKGDSQWEYVNWTSSYHWQYSGYLPDALINTYHANPHFYWPSCASRPPATSHGERAGSASAATVHFEGAETARGGVAKAVVRTRACCQRHHSSGDAGPPTAANQRSGNTRERLASPCSARARSRFSTRWRASSPSGFSASTM